MWKFWENTLYYIYRYISTIFNMLTISLFKPLESLKMLCLISQQMCNLFNILKILMLHVIKCYHLLEFFFIWTKSPTKLYAYEGLKSTLYIDPCLPANLFAECCDCDWFQISACASDSAAIMTGEAHKFCYC